jgi:hypothetical protein
LTSTGNSGVAGRGGRATRTKAKNPQTNGICERFHRTLLDEFYRVAFRKKIYRTIDELEADLAARKTHPSQKCG